MPSLAVLVFGLAAVVSQARVLARRSGAYTVASTPISESVTLGEGNSDATVFQGSEIVYNMCMKYDPARFMNIKVCGTGTKVEIFLRGNCEKYHKYMEIVGNCAATAAVGEDSCMETNTKGKLNWLP